MRNELGRDSLMRFTLMSDLHCDFPQNRIPYDELEEYVVIAGDTTNSLEGLAFLNKLRRKGHKVFACDGNHEHYSNYRQRRTVSETSARFREDNPWVGKIGDTPIVLRNGWYPVANEDVWLNYMNDGKYGAFSAVDANVLAINEAAYIKEVLQSWKDYQYKGVVVTHTAPCVETLNPAFENSYSNQWYWNPNMRPLLEELSEQIHVWCHGHTHAGADAVVDGVRVVCNPRGYPGENPKWAPMTIFLDKEDKT